MKKEIKLTFLVILLLSVFLTTFVASVKAGCVIDDCAYGSSADGHYAVVSGGVENKASGDYATVSGGVLNEASGDYYATISGGCGNIASGYAVTVSGGYDNAAVGNFVFYWKKSF